MHIIFFYIKNIYNSLLNFLEEKNISFFFYIFSFEEKNKKLLKLSIFFCKTAIILFPMILLINWILYKKDRKIIEDTVLVLMMTLLINTFLRKFWFSPRPFASVVNKIFINHISNSSFPSNHASLSLSVSMNLMINKKFRYQGIFLFIFGNIISLSRIHLGLHFPLDILGSLIVSLQSILIKEFIKLKQYENDKFF